MKQIYKVFSAAVKMVEVTATLPDGTEVVAPVPGLELQLLPEGNPGAGTLKLSVVLPRDLVEANALKNEYAVGATVIGEFTVQKE